MASYQNKSETQLREEAEKRGIAGAKTMDPEQLREALEANDEEKSR